MQGEVRVGFNRGESGLRQGERGLGRLRMEETKKRYATYFVGQVLHTHTENDV